MKRLGQQYLLRQMLRIEWTQTVQILNHFRSNSLRLAILRPAMHYAMPNRGQRITPRYVPRSNPSERPPLPCNPTLLLVVEVVRLVQAFHPQSGLRQSHPLNPPPESVGASRRLRTART